MVNIVVFYIVFKVFNIVDKKSEYKNI